MPYQCVVCGTGDRWRGRPLALEIDHINGEPWDDRLSNLRYLCPSCHGQTPTHARPARCASPAARGTWARPVE
ncbi:HNH endonuclease signature motif containing protein [Streptomyces sp. 8K308]|uniref:HNH endonuclease n=1 Tax=Streptomyces sp. 8K308 TaxID=2530388 RepID=UPI001FB6074B|nr:HNH endonuclease signature motif containing protein [Streptomyces sp. 8K308]